MHSVWWLHPAGYVAWEAREREYMVTTVACFVCILRQCNYLPRINQFCPLENRNEMQEPINSRDLFISIFLFHLVNRIHGVTSMPGLIVNWELPSRLVTMDITRGRVMVKCRQVILEECCLPMDPADSYHIAQFPRCISTSLPIGSSPWIFVMNWMCSTN